MLKIALDAGHGKYTAGKRCMKSLDPAETREWFLNARVCEKIENKLKAYSGYELLRVDDRNGAIDVPLKERTDAANLWGADLYFSVHHNAGVNGGTGGGIVAITYTKVDAITSELQKAFYDELIKQTGLKGNRAKGQEMAKMNLHVCRETRMPAVLVELGFMDSATDVPVILTDAFAEQCATAIVDVLVRKGGLKKKATPTADYRNSVITACEFDAVTVAYLDKYKHSAELYKALWQCLREGKKRTRN